jgi:hypothetical protein
MATDCPSSPVRDCPLKGESSSRPPRTRGGPTQFQAAATVVRAVILLELQANPPTSLDPLELNEQIHNSNQHPALDIPEGLNLSPPCYGRPEFDKQPATRLEQAWRHAGWANRRQATWNALQSLGTGANAMQAFSTCGANLWAQRCPGTDDVRLVANCCHNRFCIPCATARARRMKANLHIHCKSMKLRFITLTLKHSPTPLTDQLKRLHRDFAELRRRAAWKEHVNGGAAFVEVKVGSRDGLWHPHLHLLCEGTFWRQKDISALWHRVTGDSSIVDVREVDDLEKAGHYCVKYVTKPADASVYQDPSKLQEMMLAMKGSRLCLSFGTWRGFKLTEIPDDGREWVNVRSVERIIVGAAAGNAEDQAWFRTLSARYPNLPWPLLDLPPPPNPSQITIDF